MATGGGRQFMKPSTDPGARRSWQRTTSASDKEDNISINSIPNDLRPNNWDFSDWKPNPTTLDNSKRRKKGNPEREREQSLSQDSPPSSERNKRTPSTYPRTRITPSTPTSQRLALENLKQRMTFSDDASNDGERNNERNIPPRRPKLENYARQDTSSTEGASARPLQDEAGGEHGHIVSRLMQIREYIKQANSVKEALWKSGNPIDLGKATKLKHVIESLREQETGYLEILRDFGADKENGGLMDANNREESPLNPESVEDNYSLDFEVQSETSEATSVSVESSPRVAKRPRIEDKLGLSNGDDEEDNIEYQLVDESLGSDNMENTLVGRPDRAAFQDFDGDNDVRENEDLDEVRKNELKALRQQQELLKKLIHQQEQMRQLRGRQAALLALQKDAEQKLAEAKSRDNQVRHNLSDSNQNLTTNPVDDGFPLLSEGRRPVMQSVDNNPLTSRNIAGDRELQEIRHHLNILKKEQNLETAERQSNPELEASAALEDNRKQLQDKLTELQEKKQRMDGLLQELQNLRKQRDDVILNNGMAPETEEATALMAASMAAAVLEQREAMNEADNTVANAKETLDMLDAQGKLQKLQEVKERLNQLRSLVSYYQTASPENLPEMDEKAAFLAQLEMERNIRPEDVLDSVTEGGAVGGTTIKSDEDNRSETSRTTESHLSSLCPWVDDPEIQEKVRKLKDAKQTLKQLQDLVSRVQQSPDAAGVLTDLSEQAAILDNPVMSQAEERPMSEGEVPMTQSERDYEAKLQEQLRELNELQSERNRLLTLQQELQSFQSHFVDSPEGEHQNAPSQKKPETKKLIKRPPQPLEDDDSEQDKRPARPNPPVVKFSSNDEVYGKMRKQRMLREELRQKKRELEAIMKKEKKNYSKNQDNQSDTVSFSTDMYGASMSADATMATWGGSTVDNLESITEDNDKEDEDEDDAYPSDGIIQVEEEEEENDSDNNTYTIEDDVRQRRQARSRRQPQDREMKRRTFPRGQKQPKDGTKPKQAWSKYSRRQRRQENYRSAQELMEDDEQDDSKQMESPNSTYEMLHHQLQRTASLCKTLMDDQGQQSLLQTSSLASPPGYGYRPPGQMPDFFQQLQQQQLMMNLSQCLQQMSVQQLEIRNLQRQMSGLTLQPDLTDRNSTLAVIPDDLRMRSLTSLPTVGDSRGLSPNVLPRPDSFSMQPQFPSNFATRRSADNLLSTQTMDDNVFASDEPTSQQIHKTSLQNLDGRGRQEQYMLPRGGPPKRPGLRRPDQRVEDSAIPPLNLQNKKKKKSSSQQSHPTWTSLSDQREVKDNARRHTGEILTGLAERGQGSRGHERPGLSAGISGEGFGENSSMVSSVSSKPQGAEAPRTTKREVREEEDTGDLTLFEALREPIYSEVATLISQNESRPHFLIELFKELQLLSSDYLRQRALYAIRDIVSKFLTDQQNRMNTGAAPLPAWMNSEVVGNCTASELTPSESILTSDEEEIKRQIKDLTAAEKRLYQRTGMTVDSNPFDYAENADNDSTLSTPSNSYWDHPFAQDSLGDTAIRLDQALKRMREIEVKQGESKYNNSVEPSPVGRPISEPTSSSAVDQGSESSAASLSYSRIDTEQLNQQIKTIMKEIIPVIKEHLDNVCSSQLLDYIKRLVLSLTRQIDSSQCATFFHTQLGSALHNTLAKYEGRKLRVCGEDLLVDMSEVLFNELAFFRLMQGLGEGPSMAASSNKQQRTSSTQTKDEVIEDPSEDPSQESDTSETTDTETEEDPSANNTSIQYNAAEEEDLGKSRDDEFANEVVLDGDDNDDKKSPVQIQLAVSETKPFTRIGSDEDDEDADESQSADDPSETAVSRDAMMEKSQSNDDGNSVEALHVNGEIVENGEITIDDLPESLNITPNTENIQAKMQEEQQTNEGPEGVLVSIPVLDELAGDPLFLKEPE